MLRSQRNTPSLGNDQSPAYLRQLLACSDINQCTRASLQPDFFQLYKPHYPLSFATNKGRNYHRRTRKVKATVGKDLSFSDRSIGRIHHTVKQSMGHGLTTHNTKLKQVTTNKPHYPLRNPSTNHMSEKYFRMMSEEKITVDDNCSFSNRSRRNLLLHIVQQSMDCSLISLPTHSDRLKRLTIQKSSSLLSYTLNEAEKYFQTIRKAKATTKRGYPLSDRSMGRVHNTMHQSMDSGVTKHNARLKRLRMMNTSNTFPQTQYAMHMMLAIFGNTKRKRTSSYRKNISSGQEFEWSEVFPVIKTSLYQQQLPLVATMPLAPMGMTYYLHGHREHSLKHIQDGARSS